MISYLGEPVFPDREAVAAHAQAASAPNDARPKVAIRVNLRGRSEVQRRDVAPALERHWLRLHADLAAPHESASLFRRKTNVIPRRIADAVNQARTAEESAPGFARPRDELVVPAAQKTKFAASGAIEKRSLCKAWHSRWHLRARWHAHGAVKVVRADEAFRHYWVVEVRAEFMFQKRPAHFPQW